MATKRPIGVIFDSASLVRSGRSGDNWCITWADDDHQYTAQDDGCGWGGTTYWNNRVWRIRGDPAAPGLASSFEPEFLAGYPNYPLPPGTTGGWYGYGIVSVDGTLYHLVTRCTDDRWSLPFVGAKLITSTDHGASWLLHDGRPAQDVCLDQAPGAMFFLHEEETWAFSQVSFVQCGKDNGDAKDDYVYLYSPNGKRPHELDLARVPHDRIRDRCAYEFFVSHTRGGEAVWYANIAYRGTVHTFPEGWGLYSWQPSVVYNRPLDLYIMATGGTQRPGTGKPDDAYMHYETGSLGFYWAENPWGPWTCFYYNEEWIADSYENRLYQPKLSPKWIGDDGRDMTLIFSDAQKDPRGRSHTVNYRWNQMRIRLVF